MIRIGILSSRRGSHLPLLVDAIAQKKLSADIEIILSNKKEAPILTRAHQFGIKAQFIDPNDHTRDEYDQMISQVLQQHHIELIVLMGYMRILSENFVTAWENKIINVHPSLLPAYAGKMDIAVHESVLAARESLSGCTVHYVTKEVDAGPIILQKTCPVLADDTPETLKTRVQQLEGEALIEAIDKISLNSFC